MTYRDYIRQLYGQATRYEDLTERQILEACWKYCLDAKDRDFDFPDYDDLCDLAEYFIQAAMGKGRSATRALERIGSSLSAHVRKRVEQDIRSEFCLRNYNSEALDALTQDKRDPDDEMEFRRELKSWTKI